MNRKLPRSRGKGKEHGIPPLRGLKCLGIAGKTGLKEKVEGDLGISLQFIRVKVKLPASYYEKALKPSRNKKIELELASHPLSLKYIWHKEVSLSDKSAWARYCRYYQEYEFLYQDIVAKDKIEELDAFKCDLT